MGSEITRFSLCVAKLFDGSVCVYIHNAFLATCVQTRACMYVREGWVVIESKDPKR